MKTLERWPVWFLSGYCVIHRGFLLTWLTRFDPRFSFISMMSTILYRKCFAKLEIIGISKKCGMKWLDFMCQCQWLWFPVSQFCFWMVPMTLKANTSFDSSFFQFPVNQIQCLYILSVTFWMNLVSSLTSTAVILIIWGSTCEEFLVMVFITILLNEGYTMNREKFSKMMIFLLCTYILVQFILVHIFPVCIYSCTIYPFLYTYPCTIFWPW